MFAMRRDDAPRPEPMDQAFDGAPDDRYATRTVVSSSSNDQNLWLAAATRKIDLLLTQPGFGSRHGLRWRWESVPQVQRSPIAVARLVKCLTKAREWRSAAKPSHDLSGSTLMRYRAASFIARRASERDRRGVRGVARRRFSRGWARCPPRARTRRSVRDVSRCPKEAAGRARLHR